MPEYIQAYNSRSKKWVLMEKGKKGSFVDMSPDKFEGVPVTGNGKKKEKSESTPQQSEGLQSPKSDASLTPGQNEDKPEKEDSKEPEKSESGGGFWSFFGG